MTIKHQPEVDEDVRALYALACTMGAGILRTGSDLTTSQRRALIADLKSGDRALAEAALESMGTSLTALDKQRQLARSFVTNHDLPTDPAQLAGVVEPYVAAAKWSYSEEAGGGPAPDPTDDLLDELDLPESSDDSGGGDSGGGGGVTCEDGCAVLAAGLVASALATYVTAMIACQALGPFGIICALGASASYGLALYSIDARIDECIENCR